ncbi:MAG: HAD family hydrolase [Thermoplasmata archaeon]|nr:HAD family hydrolase [Thermoplasmata archaeon]
MDKAVFLDRDGVINRLELGKYVLSWPEFEFLKGAIEAIAEISGAGYKIIIITNQSPISRGLLTEEGLAVIHNNMLFEIEQGGGIIEEVFHCPHAPEDKCKCRKPETGLFNRVNEKYDIDYANSWFVGDFESDRQVAELVGLKFILAKGNGGLKEAAKQIITDC